MPTYNLTVDGQTYRLNSQDEMDEAQLSEAARQFVGGAATSSAPAPGPSPSSDQEGMTAPIPVRESDQQPPIEGEDAGYFGRVGRRLSEAGQAVMGVPGDIGQLVTGGGGGRIQAILKLLGAAGAPLAPITAPIEAAPESIAKGLGASEETARSVGTWAGIPMTLGVGMLGKAGKLGDVGVGIARLLGMGKAAKAGQEFQGLSGVDIELMKYSQAREAALTEIAEKSGNGGLASLALEERTGIWKKWLSWAKETGIADDPPKAPTWEGAPNVEFQNRDLNVLNALGTPLTQMARKDPEALRVMADINLTEFQTSKAIAQRNIADATGLGKAAGSIEQQRALYDLMNGKTVDLTKLSADDAGIVTYVRNKFETDRKFIIDRLRTDLRNHGLDEEKILEKIPDDWGIENYLPHIFPGEFFIKDSAGHILNDEALFNKMQAKLKIRELAQNGVNPDDLHVEGKIFIDNDLLKGLNRSRTTILSDLQKSTVVTRDEIAAAAEGDFGIVGRQKWWGNLFKRGGSPNFSQDLQYVMQTYNRGIERWSALTDLSNRVAPAVREFQARGMPVIAKELAENVKALWGYRNEFSQRFDATLQAIPGVRDLVAPYALERWTGAMKSGLVDVLLKYSPRFQAVNSMQTVTTLWPIAGTGEIMEGMNLLKSQAGKDILARFEPNIASKLGELGKGRLGAITGATEKFNQEVAFLTMYNRASKLGLTPEAAADYAILRGNVYSQFMSLSSDRPSLFRKIDPLGVLGTMFQRFNVKQVEQLVDLIKDGNVSGAGKWLGTIGLFGGIRALTFGGMIGGGWLTHRMYKDVEDRYGTTVASVIHMGLPALAGVDLSNTAMVYNPPMGSSMAEKVGNQALGPFWSIGSSVLGAALNSKAVDPSVGNRILNSIISRIPVAKELDSTRRIIMHDYDMRTVDGKLRYKADVGDLLANALGFRNTDDARLTMLQEALVDAQSQRNEVLDYAASRYGQSFASGITLGKEMATVVQGQIDAWNTRWPEFPITQNDILTRARARQTQIAQGLRQRLQKQTPRALAQSPEFANEFQEGQR